MYDTIYCINIPIVSFPTIPVPYITVIPTFTENNTQVSKSNLWNVPMTKTTRRTINNMINKKKYIKY